MAKRKKTSRGYTPQTNVPKDRPLYEGEIVDGMDPPNHMLALNTTDENNRELRGQPFGRRYRWPMTSGLVDLHDGETRTGVFVHEKHGADHWADWDDHPPTWMDPHLFMDLALQDERVRKILRVCYKKNDRHAWERLVPLFQQIFDEQYLPTIIERFEEYGAAFIAQWMIRHHADSEIQKDLDEKASR